MYKRNIEARSCNHFCCGKAIIITHLPYLPSMQNPCAVLYCLWLVWFYISFPHYLINSVTVGNISHSKKVGVEG